MEVTSITGALFVGIIVGILGRLIVPVRHRIGALPTMLIGIAAACLGAWIALGFGVADTRGIDWIEWSLQIALAALGVAALQRAQARRAPPHGAARQSSVSASAGMLSSARRSAAASEASSRPAKRSRALVRSADESSACSMRPAE